MADIKNNTGFGLLSEYGLNLGEESDVRSALRQQRISDAMQYVPPSEDSRQAAFGRLGASIGNAFGEKYGGLGVPPEIEARMKTASEVKTNFERWKAQNPDATAEQMTDKYHEEIATSAIRNGLSDIGVMALARLNAQRKAKQVQDLELEKLGLETKYARETTDSAISAALIKDGKEGMITFYPRNSNNPNSGQTGLYDPKTGNITGPDGRVLKPYEVTLTRPVQIVPYGPGGKGGMKFPPSEGMAVRNKFLAATNLQRGYKRVFELMDEAATAGAGPIAGHYGKLLSFTNQWVQFAGDLMTAANPIQTGAGSGKPQVVVQGVKRGLLGDERVEYDMSSQSGRAKWIDDNRKEIVNSILPGLRGKAEYADRYIALITDLAYAKAMTSEGGSTRSLSDMDFKNNFRAIGGSLSDPEALKEILLSDADRVNEGLQDQMSVYTPVVQDQMIAQEAWQRYAEVRASLEPYRRKQTAPGTAEAFGPAPPGMDPNVWAYMTPEQRALFK